MKLAFKRIKHDKLSKFQRERVKLKLKLNVELESQVVYYLHCYFKSVMNEGIHINMEVTVFENNSIKSEK